MLIKSYLFILTKIFVSVDNIKDYVSTNNPEPLPTNIDIMINVFDIIEVDEAHQSVTLMLKIVLQWQDFRLDVKRSKAEEER